MNTNAKKTIQFVNENGELKTLHWSRNNNKFVIKHEPRTLPTVLTHAVNELIGPILRTKRQELGLSMGQVGTRAGLMRDTKYAKHRMYEIEKGSKFRKSQGIKIGTLYAIAHAMKIEPAELLPKLEDVLNLSGAKELHSSYLGLPASAQDDKEYKIEIQEVED